jgi:hypothetical protein
VPTIIETAEEEEPLPEGVCQQVTRSWVESEQDTVSGLLRASFAPGERSQSLHVAFCPPMLQRPEVRLVQLSGSRARIKAADVQLFGIRFDLRLASTSQATEEVLIQFDACCGRTAPVGGDGGPG